MSDTPRQPDDDDATTSRLPTGRPADDRADDRADEPVTGPPAARSGPGTVTSWMSSALGRADRAGDADPGDADPGDEGGHSAGSGTISAGAAAASTTDPGDTAAAGAGSAGAGSAGAGSAGAGSAGAGDAGAGGARRAGTGGAVPAGGGSGRSSAKRLFGLGGVVDGAPDERLRRRRRWFIAAISVGAAIIVIALCAGALSIVDTVDGVRDRAGDAREARQQRDLGCLELERRLNRLTPPGAATGPAARATAIRDENAAVRIYLNDLGGRPTEDGWRQLIDARTVYADGLDRQAKSRTPAFYVAPRSGDGRAVADDLVEGSPAPCAGPVRRLAAPDL